MFKFVKGRFLARFFFSCVFWYFERMLFYGFPHTHVLARRKSLQNGFLLLSKNPRGDLPLGMFNSVIIMAYFGGEYVFVREFLFIEAVAFPEHGDQWWVEESFWGAKKTENKLTQLRDGRITVGSMWFVGQFATVGFPFKAFWDGHIMMWDGHIIMAPPNCC